MDLDAALKALAGRREGVPSEAVGYYQNFGVTATSLERARQLAVEQLQPTGAVDWEDSTAGPVEVGRLPAEVLRRSKDWIQEGIWYKSGRIFFGPEEGST